MEELNISELREIAEKATPGPWVATECLDVWVESDDGIAIAQCGDFHWVGADGIVNTEEQMKANARFFTTFDPPTVLALLSSAEAREAPQHVDDMNDLVLMGLARDEAEARAQVAEAALQSAETRAQQAEARVEELEKVANAARDLIVEGLRLTPDGLIVREKADRSDPHYRLCTALEAAGLIPSRSRQAAQQGERS